MCRGQRAPTIAIDRTGAQMAAHGWRWPLRHLLGPGGAGHFVRRWPRIDRLSRSLGPMNR